MSDAELDEYLGENGEENDFDLKYWNLRMLEMYTEINSLLEEHVYTRKRI